MWGPGPGRCICGVWTVVAVSWEVEELGPKACLDDTKFFFFCRHSKSDEFSGTVRNIWAKIWISYEELLPLVFSWKAFGQVARCREHLLCQSYSFSWTLSLLMACPHDFLQEHVLCFKQKMTTQSPKDLKTATDQTYKNKNKNCPRKPLYFWNFQKPKTNTRTPTERMTLSKGIRLRQNVKDKLLNDPKTSKWNKEQNRIDKEKLPNKTPIDEHILRWSWSSFEPPQNKTCQEKEQTKNKTSQKHNNQTQKPPQKHQKTKKNIKKTPWKK